MNVERAETTTIPAPSPEPAAPTNRTGRLALAGFGLGVLSFALWGSVGLPAPLVGVLAIIVSWLAVRRSRRQSASSAVVAPAPPLARWGLRLGLIKLALFVVFLLVVGVTAISQLGV
jgi:hypothetical protein